MHNLSNCPIGFYNDIKPGQILDYPLILAIMFDNHELGF
jgi:hypothetical protein